jgi:hypothetical protein
VGNNHGPTPVEFLLHAIAACLTSGLANIAAARGVDLRHVESTVEGDIDLLGILGLHHDLESSAGEAHSLQRLAEVHLARGDRQTATRLLRRALPLARWSLIGLHLLHRIFGNMIDAAPDVEAARAVVDRAESTLVEEDRCSFCSIMFAAPAARACADAGDLDDARRYLKAAERSEALWEGTAWQASLVEIRAHIALAEHHDARAQRLFGDAGGHVRRRRPAVGRPALPVVTARTGASGAADSGRIPRPSRRSRPTDVAYASSSRRSDDR